MAASSPPTLNEPETRNALSPAIVDALVAHCGRINQDMSVSCVIVTGAGESFSSGGNVKEMRDRTGLFGGTPAEIRRGYHHGIQKIPMAMYDLEVPVDRRRQRLCGRCGLRSFPDVRYADRGR